jgi:RNA polymerase sigma factor (sigma-70 family)
VAFLLYLGGPLADAADAAQAAMIDAFQVWSTIRTPKAWVRTVASRVLLRCIAAVRETPTEETIEPTPLLPSPTPITEWEQRHEVLRLIRLLPSRQRQVLAWTFDGYTPAQIADILDLDPAAVRQNLRKARTAVATHLDIEAARGEDTHDA